MSDELPITEDQVPEAFKQAFRENREPNPEEVAAHMATQSRLVQAQYHFAMLQQELGITVDPQYPITDIMARLNVIASVMFADDESRIEFECQVMDLKIANLEAQRDAIIQQKDEYARMEREAVILGNSDGGAQMRLNRAQKRKNGKRLN